jgi:hypothetical protein
MAALTAWGDAHARDPRTKALIASLHDGPVEERSKRLRAVAGDMDVFTCDVARTLGSPPVPPSPPGPPVVRVWSPPQVIGGADPDDLAKAIEQVTPALNDCYKAGLARKPDLAGKIAVKLELDEGGKVTRDAPAEVMIDERDTVVCILNALKAVRLPASAGPMVAALLPLELTTKP